MFAALGQVARLQLAPSEDLALAARQRTIKREVPAVRGDLTDRRGRLAATSRLEHRAFVDPTRFPIPPDEHIARLADVLGADPAEVGEPIVVAMATNESRVPGGGREDVGQTVQTKAEVRRELIAMLSRAVTGEDAPKEEPGGAAASPKRYVPVGGLLTEDQVSLVRALKIPGVHLERMSVRDYPAGGAAAGLIGKVWWNHEGQLGAESLLNDQLKGDVGKVAYIRDARGQPLWIEVGQFQAAQRGRDVRLSIDLELQRIATEELQRGVLEADAAGGRLVMVDPRTGEVLAMVDLIREIPGLPDYPWADKAAPPGTALLPEPGVRYRVVPQDKNRDQVPALAMNRCLQIVLEPGSTFKPFVWSLVTEKGKARADEVFDTEGGRWRTSYGRPIADVVKRATMRWDEVLVNSSNIGMVKGAERLSFKELREGLVRFGFGAPTGIGLDGEAVGSVRPAAVWSKYTHTSVAFGHEVAVTPVQMARAFCAFARTGELAGTIPPLRLTAVSAADPQGALAQRAIPAWTAILTRQTLVGVADAVEKRMKMRDPPETGWRYTMFGKSGTPEVPLGLPPEGKRRPRGTSGYFEGQYASNFIAGAPAENPRLVVIVVIDDPGPELIYKRQHYGTWVAGPVVRRVLERSLPYLGVPASPKISQPTG